jgi:hypothetical protein
MAADSFIVLQSDRLPMTIPTRGGSGLDLAFFMEARGLTETLWREKQENRWGLRIEK